MRIITCKFPPPIFGFASASPSPTWPGSKHQVLKNKYSALNAGMVANLWRLSARNAGDSVIANQPGGNKISNAMGHPLCPGMSMTFILTRVHLQPFAGFAASAHA